jgi:hypothetical protein
MLVISMKSCVLAWNILVSLFVAPASAWRV